MAKPIVATYFAPGEFPDGASTELEEIPVLSVTPDLRSAGSASLEQMLTASVQPASGGVIAFDVRDFDGGLTRAFVARCKTATYATKTPDPKDQRAKWECPGHLEVLSKGLITPTRYVGLWPKMQTIAFNWAHPDYDQSAWTTATSMSSVADAKSGQVNEWGASTPGGPWAWSDEWAESNALTADIIGPDDGSVTDVSNPNAPNQDHYFRQVIAVGTAGAYRMAVSADNTAEFYMDGVLLGTYDDWLHLTWFDVDLTPGFHVVAVHLSNYPATIPNPCGYSWALYSANGVFTAKSVAADTVHVEYQADPPGMSWGEAWRHAFQPHIDAGRSWALAIDWDFDDDVDSAGNAWSKDPNLTAQVGKDSLLSLWQKGQQSYIDGWMDENGWTLHAYNFGTYAPTSGFTMETGNLTTLTHKTEEPVAEELLVDSELGVWLSVGSGETQGFVAMGTEVALGDVNSRGEQILAVYGDVREEITGSYEPRDNTEIPYVNTDLRPGSIANAPLLSGDASDERVLTVTLGYSESADRLMVGMTLKDRIQERNERIITELESQ